jgi:hypothetical protein
MLLGLQIHLRCTTRATMAYARRQHACCRYAKAVKAQGNRIKLFLAAFTYMKVGQLERKERMESTNARPRRAAWILFRTQVDPIRMSPPLLVTMVLHTTAAGILGIPYPFCTVRVWLLVQDVQSAKGTVPYPLDPLECNIGHLQQSPVSGSVIRALRGNLVDFNVGPKSYMAVLERPQGLVELEH